MTKPIIVVFGATGKSGGGMIDAILADGTFQARAVTRYPDIGPAKALAQRGVEVVKANLSDLATIAKTMEGAYGVFGVTDFWSAFMEEEQQGKDMVDAAKAAGVKHFVWNTLDHSEQWATPHYETKARVNDYLIASGVPRTSLYTSWFAENIKSPFFFPIKRDASGTIVMDVGYKTDAKIPVIAASDIGAWALVAFKNPREWIGKDMKVATEWITPREIGKLISEETGEKVDIKEVDDTKWKALRTKEYEEMWLNLQIFYTAEPDYRDVDLSLKLLPNAKTMKDVIHSWGKSVVE